jgi:hypothetical protein
MRHGPGLAASPPVRYILVVARERDSPFARPLWTDKPFAKRRRDAYGVTVGAGRSRVRLRIQPPNEEFLPTSIRKLSH